MITRGLGDRGVERIGVSRSDLRAIDVGLHGDDWPWVARGRSANHNRRSHCCSRRGHTNANAGAAAEKLASQRRGRVLKDLEIIVFEVCGHPVQALIAVEVGYGRTSRRAAVVSHEVNWAIERTFTGLDEDGEGAEELVRRVDGSERQNDAVQAVALQIAFSGLAAGSVSVIDAQLQGAKAASVIVEKGDHARRLIDARDSVKRNQKVRPSGSVEAHRAGRD